MAAEALGGAEFRVTVHGIAAVRVAVHRPPRGHAAQVQEQRFVDEFDAHDGPRAASLFSVVGRAEPAPAPAELLVVMAVLVQQVEVPGLVAAIDDVAAAADAVVQEHVSAEGHAAFITDADVEREPALRGDGVERGDGAIPAWEDGLDGLQGRVARGGDRGARGITETRVRVDGEEHAALFFVDEVARDLVIAVGIKFAQGAFGRTQHADFARLESEDAARRGAVAGSSHGAEGEFAAFFEARAREDVPDDLIARVEFEEVRERVGIHQHRDALELDGAIVGVVHRDERVDGDAKHVVVPDYRIH